MFVLSEQLKNLEIISLRETRLVARLGTPIINSDDLVIKAFFCLANNFKEKRIVLVNDIARINRVSLIINSEEDISMLSEVVRIKDLVQQNFQLKLLPVYTESGRGLGRVEDYTIDLSNFKIQKIYVKQSLFKNLLLRRLIVDRSQIVEVTLRRIIVRDGSVKISAQATEPVTQ